MFKRCLDLFPVWGCWETEHRDCLLGGDVDDGWSCFVYVETLSGWDFAVTLGDSESLLKSIMSHLINCFG